MSQLALPVSRIPARTRELDLGEAKVHHMPDWGGYDDPRRLAVIRQLAMMRGRDPRIAKLAVSILRKAGAKPREYDKQAAALLKWVQNPDNCYYVNEPGERIQDPIYTIKAGHGDCDDQVILLCTLFEAIRLPWRLVISGRRHDNGEKIRYIEGAPYTEGIAEWSHIYCMVGTPPFSPKRWYFCETTVQGVPLGWDVISGDHRYLPEMVKTPSGPAMVLGAPRAPLGHRPARLPPPSRRSPAYAMAYGDAISSAVGSSIAEEIEEEDDPLSLRKIMPAVLTGVVVAVSTTLALDLIRGEGIWKENGPLHRRLTGVFRNAAPSIYLGTGMVKT